MKFSVSVIAAFVGLIAEANAQVGAWGQCGGINYSGATTCVSGHYCSKLNDYYSQCIPGTAPGGGTPSSTTSVVQPTNPPSSTFTTSTRTSTTAPSPTSTGTGKQIRGVKDPIYHLYLQETAANLPVMGSEASSDRFIISGSIKNERTGNFLNIQDASTSYKPLKFEATATTTGWALEGDTIVTANGSPYGRQLQFLACNTATSGQYKLYLQTGNSMPAGETCTTQTIHLPCLC
ncbi:hypothetical protein BJ508DRAFT_115648 [Ascobolus immersus RN42]|uniref:CBM1 domain-containing protein n=1 Tax=Ascobolus immersus RN42 TaxID=1160509 RepID=A0A3N4I997_ASCIM|nr:hypothetical protein BJ508DRAFT_115648 [Ascobolus immersus RN42]